jgi:hypothetical protein
MNSEGKVRATSIISLLMGHRRLSTLPGICGAEKSTFDPQNKKLKIENVSHIANNEP